MPLNGFYHGELIKKMDTMDAVMRRGIKEMVFPGGVLLVSHHGRIQFHRAYGVSNIETRRPVTLETVFDLASLTKPLVTALCASILVADGRMAPTQSLRTLIGCDGHDDKGEITVEQLLRHTSGLPAHKPFYEGVMNHPLPLRRKALRDYILAEPLVYSAGTRQVYSDLGYILLAWVIESLTHMRLDHYAQEKLFGPLGIDLFFTPLHDASTLVGASVDRHRDFAATERCSWRGKILSGEVHDDNAWAVGGVEGHAGLFGAALAVCRLLQQTMDALQARENGRISGDVLRRFIRKNGMEEKVAGFDTPSPAGSSSGRYFSSTALGHLGFTGTSFWMEPNKDIIVVLLTNRVHPCRDNLKIRQFRPLIHDAAMESLGLV